MRSLLCLLVLSPLVLGQTTNCPEPTFLPLTGYYVQFDASRIINYYISEPNEIAKPMLLRPPIKASIGQTIIVDGWTCDPDGDAMKIAATKGTITLSPANTWRWTYKPTQIGLDVIDVTLADVRATGDSKTVAGSIVILTIPANRRPGLGCGSRP
jgi:hypothetical protein